MVACLGHRERSEKGKVALFIERGGRNLGAHRLMLEPHFFADGPRWAAQPPSVRPRCQVTKPRGWERAPLAAPVGDPSPGGGGGCLTSFPPLIWWTPIISGLGPLGHHPCCPFSRRDMSTTGPGDTGGAGLVPGAAGDHADLPLRERDGISQGEEAPSRQGGTSPWAGPEDGGQPLGGICGRVHPWGGASIWMGPMRGDPFLGLWGGADCWWDLSGRTHLGRGQCVNWGLWGGGPFLSRANARAACSSRF